MSKEKFELAFLAGGALLEVLGTRLRRDPETPQEAVGAAMFTLGQAINEHACQLPDPQAARCQVSAIRAELCAPRPRRMVLAGYVEELAGQVAPVSEVAGAVEDLRVQLASYFRWRLGRWSLRQLGSLN